jgi:serine protease Do
MRTSTPFSFPRPFRASALVLAACALLTCAAAAPAQERDPRAEFLKSNARVLAAFKEVTAKPSQSTVRVRCDGKPVVLGTVVAADGWILTKSSELKGKITCVLNDGRELDAEVKGVSEPSDLAMLKVEAKGLKPVEFRDSKEDPVGNWVATVGVDETPVAVGVVSVAARKFKPGDYPRKTNHKGGFLGVGLEQTEDGPRVMSVKAGAAAEKAGVKVNDIILAIGPKAIKDHDMLSATLEKSKPGEVVVLKVKRGDAEKDLEVKLGEWPRMFRDEFDMNRLGGPLSERRTGFLTTLLQHDTVLKPYECGGPLVDLDGKTVGINIARGGRTESYAIPAEEVRALLADLQSGKLAPAKEKTQPVKEPAPPAEKKP